MMNFSSEGVEGANRKPQVQLRDNKEIRNVRLDGKSRDC